MKNVTLLDFGESHPLWSDGYRQNGKGFEVGRRARGLGGDAVYVGTGGVEQGSETAHWVGRVG